MEQHGCGITVVRLVSDEQHHRVLMLSVRQPWPSPHFCVHMQSVFEMPLCIIPEAESRRQGTQVTRQSAVTSRGGANYDIALFERQEDPVEYVSMGFVFQEGTDVH